jgi:hypothetical protein
MHTDSETTQHHAVRANRGSFGNTPALPPLPALIWLAAAAGAFIVWFGTSNGIGLSPDSANYLAAARGLLTGSGMVHTDGTPLTIWPPFYPTSLALVSSLGIEITTAARLLNALGFAIIIGTGGLWLLRNQLQPVFVLGGTFALLFSMPLLESALWMWSEVLFAVLVMMCLFSLDRYTFSGLRRYVVVAGVLAALACLTRYTGIAVLGAAPFAILVFARTPFAVRIRDALLFVAIAAPPIALWVVRNVLLGDGTTGPRIPSTEPLTLNVYRAIAVAASWFFTIDALPPILVFAFTIMVGVALFTMFGFMRMKWTSFTSEDQQRLRSAGVLATFAAGYILLLLASTTKTHLTPIDHRYMLPVFTPIILPLLLVFGLAVRRGFLARPHVLRVSVVLFVGWSMLAIRDGVLEVARAYEGRGFANHIWRGTDLGRHLEANPIAGRVYSNDPWGYYALTGRFAAQIPDDGLLDPSRARPLPAGVAGEPRTDDQFLVWIDWTWQKPRYDLDLLHSQLRPTVIRSDGIIYSILPHR